MSTSALAVPVAVASAVLFGTAAAVQQRAARQAGRELSGQGFGRLLRRLARDRLWLLGWGVDAAGFLVQALALHLGSVTVVQPLLVSQLVFSLLAAAALTRRAPVRGEVTGAGLVAAGLALLLLALGADEPSGPGHRGRLLVVAASGVLLVATLVLGARGRGSLARTALLATASGVSVGFDAAFIKLTTSDLVDHGVVTAATDWVGYALAVSTLGGLLLQQGAFAAGRLSVAVAAVTIAQPLVAFVLGPVVFAEPLPGGGLRLSGAVVAGLLVAVGVTVLARSPEAQQLAA